MRAGRDERAEMARRALADQALSVLASAQDGAIGAGLPATFDSARARWGPLSPPVSAYVARVLLREHVLDEPWQARLHKLLRNAWKRDSHGRRGRLMEKER